MLINQFTWPEVLNDAKRLGIPLGKKRGILREFLQTRVLYYLYSCEGSQDLSFVGGTSLRLLRGSGRFSQDLDFDNLGLPSHQVSSLLRMTKGYLEKEGFKIEVRERETVAGEMFQWKFPQIVFELGISYDRKEKLIIKFDFSKPQEKLKREVLVLNRFGVIQSVVSYNLQTILGQKIRALLTRRETKGRDIYDIVWLISRGVTPFLGLNYFKKLKIKEEKDLYVRLLNFVKEHKEQFERYKKQVEPFLIKEEEINYLDLFPALIKTKVKEMA